ncbi:MAG: trypsin-like peptidase domain-containing protein [Bacteroidetes bacterium]|nr:trypsin-like peptidase domain-containing protein [Bacteroidota bacterium]
MKISFTIALVSMLLICSCASILNGEEQRVTITTNHEENKIFLNDSLIGTGKVVEANFRRDLKAKEIRIEREGYEAKGYAVIQTMKSPLYFFSVIPFGIAIYPPFMDSHPKAFNYPVTLPVYSAGGEYVKQIVGNKFIFVNQAKMDVKEGDLTYNSIPYEKYIVGEMEPFKIAHLSGASSNSEILKGDNYSFLNILNNILQVRGFMDTTGTILKRQTNTLYIDATMKKLNVNTIYRSFINAGASSFMLADFEFEWVLRDVYKQELYSETIRITTDEFRSVSISYMTGSGKSDWEEQFDKLIKNGLEKSLITFIARPEVQKHLPIEKEEELKQEYLIDRGDALNPSKLAEAIKACVTIVTSDKSHGSGFFINDHLLITNYHVVAGFDTLTIITNDGFTHVGVVVRKSENYDLAIIETKNFDSPYCLSLATSREAELGEEIYAIGTPSSIEFTQTLSKGIVSGRRKTDEVDLIQTDVSINPGNSGGPIVDSKGILIGVVNGKLVGNNIEGIGFGIPSEKIVDYLRLKL